MERRPLSLQARLLIAASLALFGFLGLTGFALDQAYYESSLQGLRDRLQSYVWGYLGDTDVSVAGKIIPPEFPPEARFDRPRSGLYAAVVGADVHWQSPSALGQQMPLDEQLETGETVFSGPIDTPTGRIFRLSQGITLPSQSSKTGEIKLTIHVAEHEAGLQQQMEVFRRTLWTWLVIVALVLLAVQLLVLRWSLRPLRRVATDLALVERGEADRLPGAYPRELEGLTASVNAFIEGEREQRMRYRHTLADLAHSLKTPLAVVRNELDTEVPEPELRTVVGEQVARMDQIVAYQLSRAATSGHQTFAAPIALEDSAEEIVRSLEKVYAEKGVLCEFEIDPRARFYGEQGDLMELLGNLLENAFKWANKRVLLTVTRSGPQTARRGGLDLRVEDDGPGIPPDQVERLLQRGVRGDERVQGHGIGLSIVLDILKAYRGELSVTESVTLGGACFAVSFAPIR